MSTSITANEATVRAIRAALAEHGLAQIDLAQRCGVSRGTIVKRLTGHVRLHVNDVFQFADAIGVRPHELIAKAQRILDAEGVSA